MDDVDKLSHNLNFLLETLVNLLWKRAWHWHAFDTDFEHGYERARLIEIQWGMTFTIGEYCYRSVSCYNINICVDFFNLKLYY